MKEPMTEPVTKPVTKPTTEPMAEPVADQKTQGRGRTPTTGFDRRLLPPMMLGSVLNPINSTIIAVTLVPIGDALGAPPSQTAWLVSALYLATALGQPVVGRLIDIFGPRRL